MVVVSNSREIDGLGANCFVTKPVDLDQFTAVVTAIEQFWFTIVKLPDR